MPSRKIAERLISAKTGRERKQILSRTARDGDLKIARHLKNICYEIWTSKPAQTRLAAAALQNLVEINQHPEIEALGFWVAGVAALTRGKFEKAVGNLDSSAEIFHQIKKEHEAAQTQVAKLISLALQGKYGEAIETGQAALKIFEKYGDELAAGKIEKNLGNIIARQNDILSAEKYYLSALRRFAKVGNIDELAMCETNLADNYADLNNFFEAEKFYALALKHAREAGMFFVEAEIEASLGNLAMFRGKYDEALRFLELSRQKFEKLGVTHRSLIAALEIAEIYQTLNLADEAFEIYETAAPKLRRLKLQGDEAKARANFGRVALAKKEFEKARRKLNKSAHLYALERNPGGLAEVKLTEAHLELLRRNFPAAEDLNGMLGVGASTRYDKLAVFSTFERHWVEVVAPGEEIVSAIPGGRYGMWSGTSMSAPIVSGIAALVKSKYPLLMVPHDILGRIKETGIKWDYELPSRNNVRIQTRRVDALCAVTLTGEQECNP